MQAAPPKLQPECIGHYQVLEMLGAGGMGVVYKALDRRLNRTVALKFLAEDDIGREDRQQLLREARAASALDHANIGTIYSVEESEDGRPFLVMAFYDGEALSDRLRRGPLTHEHTINIGCQVARGLQHAHRHGIVHRDIKPSNVIITGDGVAKIVDFGLARRSTPTATTQSGNISGTLAYMSPEQALGDAVDARTDIWSLGVMLYQMLTGRLPFSEGNAGAVLRAVLQSPPAPAEGVPDELRMVLYRALAKDPAARYQSCGDLLQEIERCAPKERERATSVSRWKMRQLLRMAVWPAAGNGVSRLAWATAVLVLIAASVMTTVLLVRQRGATAKPGGSASKHQPDPKAAEAVAKAEPIKHGTHEQRRIARTYFEQAIGIDPEYAEAYAGLADFYWSAPDMPPREAMPHAKKNIQEALRLDPELPQAHTTQASIFFYGEFDWQKAEGEYRRIVKLSPNDPDGHNMYSIFLATMGRSQESLIQAQRVRALEPNSVRSRTIVGWSYYYSRRFPEAEAECKSALEIDPRNPIAFECMGVAGLGLGNAKEAIDACRRAIELTRDAARMVCLARAYAMAHRNAEARRILSLLLADRKKGYLPASLIARVYAALGDKAEAFAWLDTAYAERDSYLVRLKVDESFDPLRLDPRFEQVLSRVGLSG